LPTMVGPSKSRPPMSQRKSDSGIPCRSKSAKVVLALQLPFLKVSESMGNHDSKIVDAGSVD
jgi:hypothetical protein